MHKYAGIIAQIHQKIIKLFNLNIVRIFSVIQRINGDHVMIVVLVLLLLVLPFLGISNNLAFSAYAIAYLSFSDMPSLAWLT